MELYLIIDDWCQTANNTNELARRKLALRKGGIGGGAQNVFPYGAVPMMLTRLNVRAVKNDLDSVMEPPAPWVQRWRSSRRRMAARRTLRSMLRVYEPALLDAFEKSVEDRVSWVEANSERLESLFGRDCSIDEMQNTLKQMEMTLQALIAVRNQINTLLNEKYPMGTAP
jgi:hypothetical protein